jgi:glutamate/tyrosine decarboxylase-like PLP-dependent enzyme
MGDSGPRTAELLTGASEKAIAYLQDIQERSVRPSDEAVSELSKLGGPLPDSPTDPAEVIALLDGVGSPGTVASAGPRYFGYVVGGALPVTVAANWLATAWDQNAAAEVLTPTAVACEQIAIGWLVDALGLPDGTWGGLVTGATAANFTCLATARHDLLRRQGWDLTEKGIFGAPEIRVVVGEEVHVSVMIGLRTLGFGRDKLIRVPTDEQGRMRADALPELDSRTIVCVQAGNVNSGAFDPADEVCARAREAGAWVHVDGAFGLWARAAPDRRHLTEGVPAADSWATDAHKWLNVPYDCGIALCRNPESLAQTMALDPAGYLDAESGDWEPEYFSMDMSRRARGVEVWAALRSLGREGLANLIEGCCRNAALFAERLSSAGYEVLNDVVLNQVLVSFGDDRLTERMIDEVQMEGTCWMSGTTWHGRKAMRISVSSWATTREDVERSVQAILRVAAQGP